MAQISNKKINIVKDLYYNEKLTMREVAQKLQASMDAVVYYMRKNKIKRRSLAEASAVIVTRTKILNL